VKTNSFTTPTGAYFVESYGNGWAYTITDQETGANIFVQDDSAALVQFETDDFTNEDVLTDYFNQCAQGE